MKLRKQSSRRKWRNQFYRVERAAAFQTVAQELLSQPNGDAFARQSVLLSLDDWIAHNSIGEVGEREIDSSPWSDPLSVTASLFQSDTVLMRASVLAKRPYHVRHWRAKA